MKIFHLPRFIIAALLLGMAGPAFAQGTAFMYHGRLNDNSSPANGSYDLIFSVFDTNNAGNQVGSPLTNTLVGVTNGLFAALLDFGPGVFTGPERWLEMGVRTNGLGGFTTLNPRQLLTPTPYAIMANTASNLSGTLPAGQLSGPLADGQLSVNIPRLDGNATFTGTVQLNNPANTFVGSGSGLTGLNPTNLAPGTAAINISGNAATATSAATAAGATTASTAGSANTFTGSLVGDVTGNQNTTVVANVGGQTAASVAAGTSSANAATSANTANTLVKRDSAGNFAAGALTATSVNGDGSGLTALNASQLASGTLANARLSTNVALLNAHQTFSGSNAFNGVLNATNVHNVFVGTIIGDGGGLSNLVAGVSNVIDGIYASIAGGLGNTATGKGGFVGGGAENTIGHNVYATIAGGEGNRITGGWYPIGHEVIGGGLNNYMYDGIYSFIGGGQDNFIGYICSYGTIAGGINNDIRQVDNATIGAGNNNSIEKSGSGFSGDTIGGGSGNRTSTGANATIAGGIGNRVASDSPYTPCGTIGGGGGNSVAGSYATIAGGQSNSIGQRTGGATIAGGTGNNILTTYSMIERATGETIGGGRNNFVLGEYGTIAGGADNVATNNYTTIAGGSGNNATNEYATVGGGKTNISSGYSSTVGGGESNTASGESATVGGGSGNTASGLYAAVPGGRHNTAVNYAFAAGRRAKAVNSGSFVWADSVDADLNSTADNQFLIRASGGVGIGTDSPVSELHVNGTITAIDVNPTSDRNVKEHFATVNGREVLEKVARLSIESWNFKQKPGIRHIGPMAQDFYAAFAVGSDDKHIATVDADGVALAAIQGLNQKLEEKDAEIRTLQKRLEVLEQAVLGREMAPSGGGQ